MWAFCLSGFALVVAGFGIGIGIGIYIYTLPPLSPKEPTYVLYCTVLYREGLFSQEDERKEQSSTFDVLSVCLSVCVSV